MRIVKSLCRCPWVGEIRHLLHKLFTFHKQKRNEKGVISFKNLINLTPTSIAGHRTPQLRVERTFSSIHVMSFW